MQALNTIEKWKVEDPFPDLRLEDINPISQRIFSLMCRQREHHLLKQHFFEISGAIDMTAALDYHYDLFIKHKNNIAMNENMSHLPLKYEAIAYVNRLGQFYYFYLSDLCSNLRESYENSLFVKITKKFRMKNTAHRSIDSPRRESIEEQLAHALIFTDTMLRGTSLGATPLPHKEKWEKMKVIFKSNRLNSTENINLILEEDHDKIMGELFSFFKDLLS
ncbi:MAG: hypothetical protein RI580_10685 [Halothece sp. Uz-M2-17]|nr:hypothetical protein [Halothece sp. Uz-M2-17]